MKLSEIVRAMQDLVEKHEDPEVIEIWSTMDSAREGMREYKLVIETENNDLEVLLDL